LLADNDPSSAAKFLEVEESKRIAAFPSKHFSAFAFIDEEESQLTQLINKNPYQITLSLIDNS